MNTRNKLINIIVILIAICIFSGCDKKDNSIKPELEIESTLLEIPAEGGSITLTYQLNNPINGATISIISKEDWISDIDKETPGFIKFNVKPNQSENSRETTIEINYPELTNSIQILLIQSGIIEINLEKDVVEVPYEGCRQEVKYTITNPASNAELTTEHNAEWIQDIAVSKDVISFTVHKNNLMETRETAIIVKYSAISTVSIITIKQEAAPAPIIKLSTTEISIPAEGGSGKVEYEIINPNENIDIAIQCKEEWVEFLDTKNSAITFNVNENTSGESRNAIVNITYEGAENQASFTISQEKSDSHELISVNVNGVHFDMIYVQGGEFTMGATDEQDPYASIDEYPKHQVTLSDYYIGKYEVTQDIWVAVMGSNPSFNTGMSNPVEQVTYEDCLEFIDKLNTITGMKFSLPTEAQWEYAARGGCKSKDYIYSGSDDVNIVAWSPEISEWMTHSVGELIPNELGLYDMSGNVAEWCIDYYGDYTDEHQTNPLGPNNGSTRVIRGGSYASFYTTDLRNSARYQEVPDYSFDDLGLRLVLIQ